VGLGVEEVVGDACLNFYEAFSLSESQDFDEFGILGFFKFLDIAKLAYADFDFCAFIGLSELVGANLCPEPKIPSVSFYVFPIFYQIDQTDFTFNYGSLKSLRTFWRLVGTLLRNEAS